MNISLAIYSPLLFFLYISSLNCFAEQDKTIIWEKINEKSNISVFSTEAPGSDILKIKTQTIIIANISDIQSILNNVKHRKNWVPYLKESSIIEDVSSTENIEYSLFSAPWPASDRELVYKITHISNNEGSSVYEMRSTQHIQKPENDSRIRSDLMESTYILTALSDNKTQVELIYHADPKGWLPNWIINIIQRILPYFILKNLRTQVELYKTPTSHTLPVQ